MKICVISTPIFSIGMGGLSGYGGLEQIAWESAKGLAALGHDVSLVAPNGSFCPNVTIIPVGDPGTIDERNAFKVYQNELPKHQVIIDHSWQKYSYLMKMEGKLTVPVLGVMHAPVNTMYQSLPNVDKPSFVCISHDQGNHFEALHSRPARVCYNGVDLDMYKPIAGMARTKRFLFLARFSSIKGPDLCLDLANYCNVELDLVGDTSITNEPEYFQQCLQRCDGNRIRMIGPCKRGESVWWFSRAFALLHLNLRFREPLGLAPLEAMACGTPVVAWNFGAMKETVKHGESGYLVNSMEQAYSIVSDGALENLDRKRCREWASQFSIQNMINRYEELCIESIETGGW